jgi:aspartyl-tRNA(Asn)/glutamyl-tRNA(Gln) amidotransferase subunit A
MRSTFGSGLYADHVPLRDELPVARLRAAGAVLLGKTNTPEFALQGYTDNALFGVTRNPWDLSLTPGGSSGGAVSAVAAGIGPIALATDGGGSIRRPCAHNGCTGLKPSAGRVPRSGGFPAFLHDFEVVGPIARDVNDLTLVMDLIAPFSALDSRSGSWRHQDFSVPVASPSRILLLTDLGLTPVDAETRTSTEGAARMLESLGHQIEADVPEELTVLICAVNELAWPVISQSGLAWFLDTHFSSRLGEISPALEQLLLAGRQHSGASYAYALDLVQRLRNSLSVLFERIDFLLLPSAAALPWAADQSHPPFINGVAVGPRGHAVFTAFVNAAGLPALALPAKPSALGLPIGVQLIGRQGDDARLCSVGLQYQQDAPWPPLWQNHPERPLASIHPITGMQFA